MGVLTLVMSSSVMLLSLAACKSSPVGASGGSVSIVTTSGGSEAALSFPAASVALAVMLWTPSANGSIVMLNGLSASPPPSGPCSSLVRTTVEPDSASPSIVGVLSLVMSSVSKMPLSLAALRSSPVGASGATVSISTDSAEEGELTLPRESVEVAVMS